jgi:hypothetical protein
MHDHHFIWQQSVAISCLSVEPANVALPAYRPHASRSTDDKANTSAENCRTKHVQRNQTEIKHSNANTGPMKSVHRKCLLFWHWDPPTRTAKEFGDTYVHISIKQRHVDRHVRNADSVAWRDSMGLRLQAVHIHHILYSCSSGQYI